MNEIVENEARRRAAMALRRGFLILAAPLVLFLTIWSVLQWRQWWLWLFPRGRGRVGCAHQIQRDGGFPEFGGHSPPYSYSRSSRGW
jgi:hypothetical protein